MGSSTAAATLIVGLGIKYTIGWRIDPDDEVEGIDAKEHGEAAYDLGMSGARRGLGSLAGSGTVGKVPAVKEEANA
jgi:ammonium transporter, Amt family